MRNILSIIRRGEIIVICLLFALFVGIKPPTLHAQEETPQLTAMGYPAVIAYTTDHPIDPSLLILATPDGRWAIAPLEGCDMFSSGDQILYYMDDSGEPFMLMPKLSGNDHNQPYNCHIKIVGKVDDTPCFTDKFGHCDITQEEQQ